MVADGRDMGNPDPYIEQLEAEKRKLEERVKELQEEIRSINNIIARRRSDAVYEYLGKKINKKNEQKAFLEMIIMQILEESKGGKRTVEIYKEVSKRGYHVKYGTLRAYITGMRDKGLITKRAKGSYRWVSNKLE